MKQIIFILFIILCSAFSAFAQQYPYNYNPPKKELTPAEEQAIADSIKMSEDIREQAIADSIAFADWGNEDKTLKKAKYLVQQKDYTGAVELMKRITHLVWVQERLGICYEDGQGVTQSYKEAAYWYRKAADQGSAFAQYFLGYAYEYGEGVTQSYSDAAYWYRKAAGQGDAKAQTDLALLYANGKGVSLSYAEAVYWFRKAAEQGYKEAQHNLGIAYETGKGISQDYWQARYWYRKAADQGYSRAIENLRRLDAEGR